MDWKQVYPMYKRQALKDNHEGEGVRSLCVRVFVQKQAVGKPKKNPAMKIIITKAWEGTGVFVAVVANHARCVSVCAPASEGLR